MILRILEFRNRVFEDLPNLVTELRSITGRFGEEEAASWSNSLPRLAKAFTSPSFNELHLYFNGTGALTLEYQLPAAQSWCDVVLLGRDQNGPSAVIIELKHWQTHSDSPGAVAGLINHFGEAVLHPSDQVRGYVEYCRRFHSTILDHDARVAGCVLFTQNTNTTAYQLPPNEGLTADFPCFAYRDEDLDSAFPKFISERISAPDPEFAISFERGTYKQDRGFVRQIGAQILHPEYSPFVLLDNQRRAFSLCRAQVKSALFDQGSQTAKKVIVVEGPPGSGKSVVAAKIWAALATDEKMPEGPIVFTSTSASQNSNWSHLFRESAATVAGSGVVKKATSYTPITTAALGNLRARFGRGFLGNAATWRENMKILRDLGQPFHGGARDGEYLVSVVDEAHALINPEKPEGRVMGVIPGLGPHAYHIIRVSQVSIFLLDERQSFRSRENTTVSDLRNWATELGAEFFTVSLAGNQFRCAGSKEYVDWVEAILRGDDLETCRVLASAWTKHPNAAERQVAAENVIQFPAYQDAQMAAESPAFYGAKPRQLDGTLDFQIFDHPAAMEAALRTQLKQGHTARLLAPYARLWKTRGQANPHDLPWQMKDFAIPYEENGEMKMWSKIWNFVPNNGADYATYIQGRPGSRIHDDPLSEVGCPYAVRGFDWDYVGILWFSDMVISHTKSHWIAQPKHVFETGFSRLTTRAANESNIEGPHHQNLLEALAQCYRILLTRPIRGVYIWFEDESTRAHFQKALSV